MAHSIEVKYVPGLRTESTHLASGVRIFTDAPVDNLGRGESFSPTDLACSSHNALWERNHLLLFQINR